MLILVVGLAVLIAALQMPLASINESIPAGAAGSEPNQVYFFQPMTLTISISQLQGNATLLVQPVNYDSTLGNPVVNVSVVEQDIIIFTIHNRGYYEVTLTLPNGSVPAVTYVIDESGVPSDLFVSGIILVGTAGLLYLAIVLISRRARPV